MTLTTHAAVAVALTKPLMQAHPLIIFAVASHYLSDAIPHWDYSLRSANTDPDGTTKSIAMNSWIFLFDLARTAFDALLGAGIVLLVIRPRSQREFVLILLAIVGGMLSDFLQGLYLSKKAEFLKPLQTFHDWMHTKIKLRPYPAIGIPFQLAILFFALWIIH